MELDVKLWVPLANTLREMKELGAGRPQVIRMLRAALKLMEEDEAQGNVREVPAALRPTAGERSETHERGFSAVSRGDARQP
jgi:hypothetical protein